LHLVFSEAPNGQRYLQVGGRGFCLGAEKSLKPEKRPENAATPTCQVHALLESTPYRNQLPDKTNAEERGLKPGGQIDPARTPAALMTRRRANCHNPFERTAAARILPMRLTHERHSPISKPS